MSSLPNPSAIGKNNMLRRILAENYPYYYGPVQIGRFLAIIFILIFFFNYVIQPFGNNPQELAIGYFWASLVHSLSPLFALSVCGFFLNAFMLRGKTNEWKINQEILFLLVVFLLTGILQFGARGFIYNIKDNLSLRYLSEEVTNTSIGGFFLALIVIPFNYYNLRLKNERNNRLVKPGLGKAKPVATDEVFISTEQRSEDFLFDIREFLYANSDGNYLDIYFLREERVVKLVKRLTLKSLENQLHEHPFILKVHRSVLLNLRAIEKVSGNAQGYKVKLHKYPLLVPVSRKFIPVIDKALAHDGP